VLEVVWETTEGNPFFIEEVVAMFTEQGLMPRGEGSLDLGRRPRQSAAPHPRSKRCSALASTSSTSFNSSQIARAAVVGMRFTPQDVAALARSNSRKGPPSKSKS